MTHQHVKLGLIYSGIGRHASAWRLPEAEADGYTDPALISEAVKIAERGKLDFFFVGNSLTSSAHRGEFAYTGKNVKVSHDHLFAIEGFTTMAYAAAFSEKVGLVVTFNTTYNDPFHIARVTATLDHLSRGRLGLNIVTGSDLSAAFNFGQERHLDNEDRYDRVQEFTEVLWDLWDSWEDDWLVADKEQGIYHDVSKAHRIDHTGKHFSIRGPLNFPRPPQGHIPFLHPGYSERSLEYGAQYADMRFIHWRNAEWNKAYYADIKSRVVRHGREEGDHLLISGITPYVAENARDAHAKFREVQDLSTNVFVPAVLADQLGIDLTGRTGTDRVLEAIDRKLIPEKAWIIDNAVASFDDEDITLEDLTHYMGNNPISQPAIVGDAKQLADFIETNFHERAFDGVAVCQPYWPGPAAAFVDLVVPELQRRGVFRTEYTTSTLREHLGLKSAPNRLAERSPAEGGAA
ncbi:NtaA/DmoA family FMN-dependent monooxygenase [Dactylosporangium sp. NPDC051484]|uniref:NtaA/DmoA family FMN-dependent monooxygenase n=1 Tax=Dactylosporangium sp. NPDC051484 TaxID=3154942 RepID=UPI00344C381B